MNTKDKIITKIKQKLYPIWFYICLLIYNIIQEYLRFLEDDSGHLLIPLELKLTDEEYKFYRELAVDWTIPSIKEEDLRKEFSKKACKLVDLFRRKTINLDFECMLYFDYMTGEIIYCFIGYEDYINNIIDEFYFKEKHIASIHNHSKNSLSPPSPENFEILKINSEKYEIISSSDGLWILEAEGKYEKEYVKKFQNDIRNIFKLATVNSKEKKFFEHELDSLYGEYLLKFIYNKTKDIKLTKKEL